MTVCPSRHYSSGDVSERHGVLFLGESPVTEYCLKKSKLPKFIFEKSFLFTVLAIALPIALQNVISFGVNLMDSVMMGQLKDATGSADVAISAVNLGGQPFFLLTIFGFGIASGGSVLIAQYWGKQDMSHIRRVFALGMRTVFFVSLLFTILCAAIPRPIMSLFTDDAAVLDESSKYLRLLSASYLFYSLSNCYLMSLRAVERVLVSTCVYAISFFVNIFFNWCFIFGKCGCPALGVSGAAVGTIFARASEFAMAIGYMYLRENRVGFRIKDIFASTDGMIRDFIKNCLPVVGNEVMWGLGTVMMTVIISNLGPDFTAANGVAVVVHQVITVAAFGVANAAAVLTGKAIGADGRERAQAVANTMLLFAFIVGIVGGALVIALRYPVLSIYQLSDNARGIALDLLLMLACFTPFLSTELTCFVGTLRGGGDTKLALCVDCGLLWLFSIPLGAVSGYALHLAPALVFFSMRFDCIIKAVFGLLRTASGKWIRDVTRRATEAQAAADSTVGITAAACKEAVPESSCPSLIQEPTAADSTAAALDANQSDTK